MSAHRIIGGSFLLALGGGCSNEPSEIRNLHKADGADYEVSVGTWKTGDYADEPFRIQVRSGEIDLTILQASQCRNVSIGQTKDAIYVFYEHLSLSDFGGSWADIPPVQLCDLEFESCYEKQEEFRKVGALAEKICTYEG